MFSYVDPTVYDLLRRQGAIVTIGAPGGEEPLIDVLGPIPMPALVDGREVAFRWYPFVRRIEHDAVLALARELRERGPRGLQLLRSQMTVNSLLALGPLDEAEAPLVRVHSCCITGEAFGSVRCECGPQLDEAFRRIAAEGCGAVVYMSGHEGRGIGLWAKGITYLLQDRGRDTYDANRDLGLPEDSRDFTDAAILLRHVLRDPPRLRLLSNNPMKRDALVRHGVEVVEVVRHVVGIAAPNLRYMHAKRKRGHTTGDLPDPD